MFNKKQKIIKKISKFIQEITDNSNLIEDISITKDKIFVQLKYDSNKQKFFLNLKDELEKHIKDNYPKYDSRIAFIENKKNPTNKIKNIITICSGKGGVGKSTISANIAAYMANLGYKVGLIDADIYGPSIHYLFDLEDYKPDVKNDKIIPPVAYGVKFMSMGFLVPNDSALIWRGPMVSKSISNLFNNSLWDDLDFLFIDMPPGTGDIHLNILKNYPITGSILISTPQQIALLDVDKCYDMLNKLNIPIIGLIENMSYFDDGTKKQYIYGKDKAEKFAKDRKIKFICEIPLDKNISELSDKKEIFVKKKKYNFMKEIENSLISL